MRSASTTTPGRYRLWSLMTAAVLALATIAAVASASQMRSSTQRAETESGPVLVATQQLVSSLAEADAAASAAFLSGRDEDPEQRRLYEQALARAGQQTEEVASLLGREDRAVRAILNRISVQVTQYAGLVEAARATNKAGSADANGYLVSAVQLAEQLVAGDVKALTDDTRAHLQEDQDRRTRGLWIAIAVLVAALVALVLGQRMLTSTSRRILNPPLVVATLLAVVALGWLARAGQASGSELSGARDDGYDALVVTAQLGSAGFGARAAETLAVITGDAGQRRRADDDAAQVATSEITPAVADFIRRGQASGAPGGLLGAAASEADSPRERAAVAEAGLRWQRYLASVRAVRSAPNQAAATAIAVGQGNADFNGFNFSVQAILGQNRGQFLDGLSDAAERTERVPTGVLLLLLAALGAMFWGYQVRINDYR